MQNLKLGEPLSPNSLDLIKKEILTLENYFHSWLDDYSITNDNVNEITRLIYEYVPKARSWNTDLKTFISPSDMSLQSTVAPLVEAFVCIKFGNFKLAYTNVMWIEKLVEYCLSSDVISKDYCTGLTYLCKLLKVDCSLHDGTANETTASIYKSVNFDDLPPKGKSLVWASKWILNQSIYERKMEATKDLEKVRI